MPAIAEHLEPHPAEQPPGGLAGELLPPDAGADLERLLHGVDDATDAHRVLPYGLGRHPGQPADHLFRLDVHNRAVKRESHVVTMAQESLHRPRYALPSRMDGATSAGT
jgi:hypothetical protein